MNHPNDAGGVFEMAAGRDRALFGFSRHRWAAAVTAVALGFLASVYFALISLKRRPSALNDTEKCCEDHGRNEDEGPFLKGLPIDRSEGAFVSFIGLYVTIGLLVAAGAYFFLPRHACIALGVIALLLGIVVPFGMWGYANLFVTGDRSAYGMLGTLLAILFAPAGLALTLLGLIKAD